MMPLAAIRACGSGVVWSPWLGAVTGRSAAGKPLPGPEPAAPDTARPASQDDHLFASSTLDEIRAGDRQVPSAIAIKLAAAATDSCLGAIGAVNEEQLRQNWSCRVGH